MPNADSKFFPDDSEAESCIHCYGSESDACGNCNGTGRGKDWASCAECGEWTWNHGTGRYQQCQECRLAEWEAEKERQAVRVELPPVHARGWGGMWKRLEEVLAPEGK
jgi:hypothetical protein